MDDERIDILMTPERAKPRDGNLRRNSMGKASTSHGREKIPPNYLRASTNSCHEFCKYGRKLPFEAKGKQPILEGITTTPAEDRNLVRCVTPIDRMKKEMIKPKPSLELKTWVPKTIKRETKITNKEASLLSEKIVIGAKPVIALKPKLVMTKCPPKPLNFSGSPRSRSSGDITSKTGKKKALVPPLVSMSPKPSVNRVSSRMLKAEPKLPKGDTYKEKILHIIEPKPENRSLEPTKDVTLTSRSSPSSSLSSSPSSSSYEEEEKVESEFTLIEESITNKNKNKIEALKVEYKRRSGRATMVHPEDNDPRRKLNFTRGKVVNLKAESSSPKRLRFKQGRVLGDNQNETGDGERKNFKRKEVSDVATNDTKPETEKVVLRHQDIEGKKDEQVSYNNVIEETASKLIKTRKGKVKALVGAFENIISLQGSKHLATSGG